MATELYVAFIVYQNLPHPGVQLTFPASPGWRERDRERGSEPALGGGMPGA